MKRKQAEPPPFLALDDFLQRRRRDMTNDQECWKAFTNNLNAGCRKSYLHCPPGPPSYDCALCKRASEWYRTMSTKPFAVAKMPQQLPKRVKRAERAELGQSEIAQLPTDSESEFEPLASESVPESSDAAIDALVARLENLEREHNRLTEQQRKVRKDQQLLRQQLQSKYNLMYPDVYSVLVPFPSRAHANPNYVNVGYYTTLEKAFEASRTEIPDAIGPLSIVRLEKEKVQIKDYQRIDSPRNLGNFVPD